MLNLTHVGQTDNINYYYLFIFLDIAFSTYVSK